MNYSNYPNAKKCEICGSSELADYSKLNVYNIVTCYNCKSRFLDPQPTDDVLGRIYTDTYFLTEKNASETSNFYQLKTKTAEYYLDYFFRLYPNLGDYAKLLEIGCGKGDFLLSAQKKGLDIYGIEISSDAVSKANERLGSSRVIQGELDGNTFSDDAFDIICLFDLLEHVRDPRKFLRYTYKYLKPGGIIFMVTPSLDSWSSKFMRRNWMEYKVEHLWYFNKKSIQSLLESTGFIDVSIYPNPKILSIDYINRHFQQYKIPFFSPVVNLFSNILPSSLANMPIKIVASGMMLFASK